MLEQAGRIIHIDRENQWISGCTTSKQVYRQGQDSIFYFSLAPDTEISGENYSYIKLCMVFSGEMEVFSKEKQWNVKQGDCIIFPQDESVGVRTETSCIYTEISFRKESIMNTVLKAGEVFQLGNLLPYEEGKIVNMDLINNDKMKFVLMSFDQGTGLSEHAALGEALIFALDGEGVIGYEGTDHPIKAGETFKFDKLGRHSVTATGKFKMALLLVLE